MIKESFLKSSFSSRVRVNTWKKLATLLKNNVQEVQALTLLKNRAEQKKDPVTDYLFGGNPVAVVLRDIIDSIHKGQPLDVALYKWVPHEEIMLIRSGKRSASLPSALMDCVELIKAKQRIIDSIIKAVAYPAGLIAMFIILLLVISFYMIPAIAEMSDPELWGGAAGALYAVSTYVGSGVGLFTLVLLFCAGCGMIFSMPYWTGSLRVRFDSAPPWSIYRLIVGSVWLFTVATLLRSRVSLDSILKDMLNSGVMQPWLQERVLRIQRLYNEDANFGKLLLDLKMNFPDAEVVEELSVYASMPDFHANMYDIAKNWLIEGIERIETQTQIINAVLLLLIIGSLCGVGVAIGSVQEQFYNTTGMM
jgi:type II secretory pathway component PulF